MNIIGEIIGLINGRISKYERMLLYRDENIGFNRYDIESRVIELRDVKQKILEIVEKKDVI